MQSFSLSGMQAHDNTLLWKEAFDQDYVRNVQDIIQKQPFGPRPFYIYQFIKRLDDSSGVKKMMHQPRLSKPIPTPGATLLRVDPLAPEQVKIVWTLPNQENFGLYGYGKMYANEFVFNCIQQYLHCMKKFKILEKWLATKVGVSVTDAQIDKCFEEFVRPERGDASDEEFREILKGIINSKKNSVVPPEIPTQSEKVML